MPPLFGLLKNPGVSLTTGSYLLPLPLQEAIHREDPDQVKLAIEMLPESLRRVGVAIDLLLDTAPWNLSSNYVEVVKKNRTPGLAITGVGDPTSRRLGYSFIRLPAVEELTAMPKRKVGGLHKTDADMRRLTKSEARRVLLEEFKWGTPEIVSKMTRWDCVGVIRSLSSAAAREGAHMERAVLFARGQKLRPDQMMQQLRMKCQDIFDGIVREFSAAAFAGAPQTEYEFGQPEAAMEDEEPDLAEELESMLDKEQRRRTQTQQEKASTRWPQHPIPGPRSPAIPMLTWLLV